MVNLKDFNADIGLLAEGGMIAIKQGDEESAKKLFNAVGILDPKSTTKKMGYGLIAVHKMDVPQSISIFKELYESDPNNRRAQAFLAFSYMLSLLEKKGSEEEKMLNLKEGIRHAQESHDNATDESTLQLSQSILDWQKELNEVNQG